MVGARIEDGDLLVIEEDPSDGTVVVALLNGEEASPLGGDGKAQASQWGVHRHNRRTEVVRSKGRDYNDKGCLTLRRGHR